MTTEPVPQVHRWRAFAVLAVSFFMTIIDLAIVNVALPTIGRKLHVSESDLQWVVTAYGITFGGFLLLGGRAADLLGRRRILMLGLAVFTAASLGAGLATSGGFLIAMRGLQGLGAAVILPAALSIVMNMFPERRAQQGARFVGRHRSSSRGREQVAIFLGAGPLAGATRWRLIPVRANGQVASWPTPGTTRRRPSYRTPSTCSPCAARRSRRSPPFSPQRPSAASTSLPLSPLTHRAAA